MSEMIVDTQDESVDTEQQATPAVSAEELARIKRALEKANKEAAQYRTQAKQFKEAIGDVDPDAIKELLAEREQARIRKAEERGEFEKLKQALVEKHTQELEAARKQVKAVESTMERYLVDSQITQSIAELEGNAKLLKPHVRSSVKVVQEEGDYRVVVLDEDGGTRYNSNGDPMTIHQFVEQLRDDADFGNAFKAKVKSGTGQVAGNTGKGGAAPTKGLNRFSMTPAQKEQYITQYGIQAYNKLPK